MPAKFCRPLEPVSGELGGTVTLACELSPAQAEVLWRCGSTQLRPGKRFQMAAAGLLRSLTVSGLRAEDAGEYVCESRDDRTSARLSVRGRHLRARWLGLGGWGRRLGVPGQLQGGGALLSCLQVGPRPSCPPLKRSSCPQSPER